MLENSMNTSLNRNPGTSSVAGSGNSAPTAAGHQLGHEFLTPNARRSQLALESVKPISNVAEIGSGNQKPGTECEVLSQTIAVVASKIAKTLKTKGEQRTPVDGFFGKDLIEQQFPAKGVLEMADGQAWAQREVALKGIARELLNGAVQLFKGVCCSGGATALPEGVQPVNGSYVNANKGFLFHIWKSPESACTFIHMMKRIWKTIVDHHFEQIKTIFSVTTVMQGRYVTGIVLPSVQADKGALLLPGSSTSLAAGVAKNFIAACQLPDGTALPFLPGALPNSMILVDFRAFVSAGLRSRLFPHCHIRTELLNHLRSAKAQQGAVAAASDPDAMSLFLAPPGANLGAANMDISPENGSFCFSPGSPNGRSMSMSVPNKPSADANLNATLGTSCFDEKTPQFFGYDEYMKTVLAPRMIRDLLQLSVDADEEFIADAILPHVGGPLTSPPIETFINPASPTSNGSDSEPTTRGYLFYDASRPLRPTEFGGPRH